jgi:hypothetical protein
MEHNMRKALPIPFDTATQLSRQPGHILIELHTNSGHEFYVVPGGLVRLADATKILAHPLCHEVDSGLFPGIPQSWSLYHGDQS